MIPAEKVTVIYTKENALRVVKRLDTNIAVPNPIQWQPTITVEIVGMLEDQQTMENYPIYQDYVLVQYLSTICSMKYHGCHTSRKTGSVDWSSWYFSYIRTNRRRKILKSAFSTLLLAPVKLIIIVDTEELYLSPSIPPNSTEKPISADVNVIRLEYEMRIVYEICWISGTIDLVYSGKSTDIPLCRSLKLLMHTGKIPIDLSPHESSHNYR